LYVQKDAKSILTGPYTPSQENADVDEARMIELLIELHDGLPRQGPGDAASTRRALALCAALPAAPEILDIGCGGGAQTLTLAEAITGPITALDFSLSFLRPLHQAATERGWASRIQVCQGDMQALPFREASFDLIWSEGAIYVMGFDAGLTQWRAWLKPGGYLAVSELSWFRPDPPAELTAFWEENYPAMRSIEANLAAADERGWEVIGHFPLPWSAWRNYYDPLQARLPAFRATHAEDADAQAVADMTASEMAMMTRYAADCGYAFYVLRRKDVHS
jgi:ubiquinone/menaquinone biosynthesis C-methylase UbiE